MGNLEIRQWTYQEVKHDIMQLSGITQTTRNIKLALDSSKCTQDEDCFEGNVPVLFVFLMKNYNGFDGFRLTDISHTPYT